jgi:hypothetical protein
MAIRIMEKVSMLTSGSMMGSDGDEKVRCTERVMED